MSVTSSSYTNKVRTFPGFVGLFIAVALLASCGGGGGGGGSDSGNVDAPVASDDAATVSEGASVTIDLAANDTDANNVLNLTSITIASAPSSGSVSVNADGTVDYLHNGSETVSDSFTYTIKNSIGGTSNAATVSITVTPVNDTPVANDDDASVNQNDSVIIDLAANDTDAEGAIDLTSITVTGAPVSGNVVINGDGTVTYTSTAAVLSDSFTYTIDDLSGATSNTATVSLTVLEGFNEVLFTTAVVSSASDSGGANVRQFQANDGITGDATNGWVAAGGDATPSITLNFDTPKTIYRVTLSDLVGLADQVTSATIAFSNGDEIQVVAPLPNDGTAESFVFPPKTVSSVTVTLETANGAFGLSEIGVFSSLDPGQTTLKTDLFNDGNVADWPVTNDCQKGSSNWGLTSDQFTQTGDCRGFSDEGVELGSYPVLDGFTVKDMDLRLRFKSTDVSGSGATWVNGAIGLLFAYRPDDYYRVDISRIEGHTKLWKKVGDGLGGANFTELTTSPQSYTPGQWVNLRVVRQNGVIVVYMNGVKTMAVEDNEPALNSNPFQIALMCARNESCTFDNLVVLSAPSNPIVGANIEDVAGHTSGEYFVNTSGSLAVNAVVTDDSNITAVEFVVDEALPGQATFTDNNGAPYTATFALLPEGEHTLRTYLRNAGGRLTGAEASDELPQVGVSGIHLVGLGDSIAGGLFDDDASDDVSTDGRNTSGGYQPVLNNLLASANITPVTVLNEGNPDETSAEGAARITAVLARSPAAQAYLTLYGANDSGGSVQTPPGTGLSCTDLVNFTGCDAGYLGSFKHNIQQIINAAAAAGKATILGKTSPHLGDAPRDDRIQDYNGVIDELIADNGFTYTAPDFHAYFTANPGDMADNLHPNGAGYKAMADGWCKHMNGVSLPDKGVIICNEASPFPN